MKRTIIYAASLLITLSAAAAPGSKLIQAFNQTFPNAQNVKWSDDKAGYFVSFYINNNFEKVFYNKSGDFICSWKYTDGKELPTNITVRLNKKYGDHTILGVTELATNENTTYNVKFSKGDKWYSVTAHANGEIVKEEKYSAQPEVNTAN